MIATSIARKRSERLPGITNNVGIRHVYYCVVGLYQ